jgi:putative phage-type endonuclease
MISGTIVTDDDRAAWLAARRGGLGASDAPAVLGLSPWMSPVELYLEKIGQGRAVEETEPMRLGKLLEPILAAEYVRRCGSSGRLIQQVFTRHRDHPWMFATLDGVRDDGRIVEFKAVGWRKAHEWGEEGTEDIPMHYLCQVHHQLAVSNAPAADLLVLVGGQEFRQYTVPRDSFMVETLVELEYAFWDRVVRRDPPGELSPDDHKVWHLLRPDPAGSIPLAEEDAALVAAWQDAARRKSEAAQEEASLKTAVLGMLGPFAAGRLPDGRQVARKVVEVRGGTRVVAPYSYTDLRIKKGDRSHE